MNEITKYGIRHKETGEYFVKHINGVFYYQKYPPNNTNSYWEFMTEASLAIVAIGGESFLEVFLHKFE